MVGYQKLYKPKLLIINKLNMEQVNVILPARNGEVKSGDESKTLSKKFFKDMVFQAYYYPNTSLTINNLIVTKRDLMATICGQTSSLNKGCFENVFDFLWARLYCSAVRSFHFKSNFEDVEYIINKL